MPAKSLAAKAFRENVRAIMEEREITITEMAEELDMSRPGLSRILSGDEAVTLDRAERIAKFLKVALTTLLQAREKLPDSLASVVDVPHTVRYDACQ